jgi:hypothetical protein
MQWSFGNFGIALLLHAIWSGWVGAGLFFYNWYNEAWWGPYFSNAAHFWATYSIAACLMNLNLPTHPETSQIRGEVVLILIWGLTVGWELLELLYFNVHLGFIVNGLDTLLNLSMGYFGAMLGVYHAEHSIP